MRSIVIMITSFMIVVLASAQNKEVEFDLFGKKVSKTKIAIPEFRLDTKTPAYKDAWQTVNEVLQADLDNSGYFDVIPRERLNLIRGPHEGPIDFEEWQSIEAQHLVVGAIREQDGSMRIEVRLFEVDSKQSIVAQAYRSKTDLARKMAHVIADDILKHLHNSQFASSRIIYTQETHSSKDKTKKLKELFIMDYDGFNPLPITKGGIALSPSSVKVGNDTMLAYAVFENAYTFNASYGIYLKPTLQSKPRVLFKEDRRRATAPALSPDGKKVAFSLAVEGNVDIFVMNIDGSDFLRLTSNPTVDTNPSWAPGGRSILFTSDRTGAPQIYRMDADGLNLTRITHENPYNDGAVWNPRYDYMAYVSRFDNLFDIFIMNLQTGENYRVTRLEGSNEDPCWSPDGEQLLFTSDRSGSWQIYAINRNGTNQRQITKTGNNRHPIWIE